MAWAVWLGATRPKTLAAGAVPVAVGVACAATVGPVHWGLAAGCLVGALLIQVGCNFANDAFDGMKGADTAARLGPRRAVASGLISARAMLLATAVVLALALGVGLWLATAGGWPILVLGLVSLVCAVAYTAGPWPLAYIGLGELFVFLFFGWFAVLGTAWVQVAGSSAALPRAWWFLASAVGFQAACLILVNNLRDAATDAPVGKRTLAVRLGPVGGRAFHGVLHLCAASSLGLAATEARSWPLAGAASLALVLGGLLSLGVWRTTGAPLNAFLARTAGLEILTGVVIVLSLAI